MIEPLPSMHCYFIIGFNSLKDFEGHFTWQRYKSVGLNVTLEANEKSTSSRGWEYSYLACTRPRVPVPVPYTHTHKKINLPPKETNKLPHSQMLHYPQVSPFQEGSIVTNPPCLPWHSHKERMLIHSPCPGAEECGTARGAFLNSSPYCICNSCSIQF